MLTLGSCSKCVLQDATNLNYVIHLYVNECTDVCHPCNRQLLHFPGLGCYFLPMDLNSTGSSCYRGTARTGWEFFFSPTNTLVFLLQKTFKHTVRNFSTGSAEDNSNYFAILILFYFFKLNLPIFQTKNLLFKKKKIILKQDISTQ